METQDVKQAGNPTPAETPRPLQDGAVLVEGTDCEVATLMTKAFTSFKKAHPDWLAHAFLDHVRHGLLNLRHYIEDPTEEAISWDAPFVELTYPVAWDFEARIHPPPGGILSGIIPVADKKVSKENVLKLLVEVVHLEAFYILTRGVVEWWPDKQGIPAVYSYHLPQALVDWLDKKTGTRTTEKGVEGPHEGVVVRRRLVTRLAGPFTAGDWGPQVVNEATMDLAGPPDSLDELEQGPPIPPLMTFKMTSAAGETLEGSVVVYLWPLKVDAAVEASEEAARAAAIAAEAATLAAVTTSRKVAELAASTAKAAEEDAAAALAARRAWFTLGVGLRFTKGDPHHFSAEELAALWERLTKPDAGETPKAETSETSTEAARSAPTAGPPEPRTARLLLDSRTRMDAGAAQLIGWLDGTALPRKWDRIHEWKDLVQAEVDHIRETHGEAAFTEAPGIRGPLLRRQWKDSGKVEVVELTKEAEEELLEREGPRGFRRVLKNEDGIQTEFLVKQWRAGGGRIRIRLAWYGLAWPLVAEGHEAQEKRLRAEKIATASALFDELTADEKRRVDEDLALLGTLKNARLVMDAFLRRFGAWGENPVRFPAHELRVLLECETDPHGHERVWAALRALQRIEYGYEAVSVGRDLAGKAVGPLVADVVYEAKGKGSHTDGDFYVTLSELALGCLRAFKVAGARIRDARKVFRFDWSATLEKDARADLDFVQSFSALAPYFDRAKGFTPHQTRLRTWLENNITLRKDGTSKGREAHRIPYRAADAGEPRVYGTEFCLLLEPSRRYYAALGHFPKNAETGRKLMGRPQARTATGGARTGGLLEVLGYDLPPGRADAGRRKVAEAALKDFRAVVEEALGGRVVGRRNGQWLTLPDAIDRIRAEELLKEVSWFLFVAEDFRERMNHTIEAHHEGRWERGETDRPVHVTTDRPAYEKAQEDQGADAASVGTADLRAGLYAKRRKRKLTTEAVGKVFGVSKMTISKWERGRDRGGAPIPEDLHPLVLRWIEKGEGPTEEELKALTARRRGGKQATL